MRRWFLLWGGLAALSCSGETQTPDAGPVDMGTVAQCPKALKFTFLSGTRTDLGWTGNLHGSSYPADSFFRAAIIECDADCRQCAFEGPIPSPEVNSQRCLSDPSQTCTDDAQCPPWECIPLDPQNPQGPKGCSGAPVPCSTPTDCPASHCRTFLGPGVPLSTGGCGQSYFQSTGPAAPLRGTIDLRSGAVIMEAIDNFLGTSVRQENCPICQGDNVPNDGMLDGTCVVSPYVPGHPLLREGQRCDAHGNSTLALRSGAHSLDCTPPFRPTTPINYTGARTSGGRFGLGPNQPDCGGGRRCWCGACEGSLDVCHESADCSGGRACVAPADMIPIGPNLCRTACEWNVETQSGTCIANDPAPPDAGMAPERRVGCFPGTEGSEMFARGSSRRVSETGFTIELGDISCRAPLRALSPDQGAIFLDMAIGLPGPQLSVLRFQVDQEF